jgi:hypothetical protein
VLALASRASPALIVASDVFTTANSCSTPLSQGSKAPAVTPENGDPSRATARTKTPNCGW